MTRLLFKIRPLTDFGSRMTGGMLFGQLVWQLLEAAGEDALRECLSGYCEGRPFAVLSDAMPSGFVPLPTIPSSWWAPMETAASRKYFKAKKWLPQAALSRPLAEWADAALSEGELPEPLQWTASLRMRNSISRTAGTTAGGAFAPYSVSTLSCRQGAQLDLYADLDESRLKRGELRMLLDAIGLQGFGRDASTGLGKFEVLDALELPPSEPCRHWLALSAMRPGKGDGFDAGMCFYRPKTYFGRHGAARALGPSPFKKPLVLADAAAFLTTVQSKALQFAGIGISGHSAYTDAVHQGYAPLLPISGLEE